MHRRNWLVMGLIAASVMLVGCEQTHAESAADKPAQVTPIQGTNLSRVVLSARAAERIGIATAAATAAGGAAISVPLAALVYDRDGSTWVYTTTAPLTYVRQRVTVARITGDVVVLQPGPPAGATVVTVGAAELLGSEYGVAGE